MQNKTTRSSGDQDSSTPAIVLHVQQHLEFSWHARHAANAPSKPYSDWNTTDRQTDIHTHTPMWENTLIRLLLLGSAAVAVCPLEQKSASSVHINQSEGTSFLVKHPSSLQFKVSMWPSSRTSNWANLKEFIFITLETKQRVSRLTKLVPELMIAAKVKSW